MSYVNAPATRLLATHCAICGRPLVDSLSVELGIGPICRAESGFDIEVDEVARARANQLVYLIAKWRSECTDIAIAMVPPAIEELKSLGFWKLANVLEKNIATVKLVVLKDRAEVMVWSPYNPDTFGAWRAIRGSRWDGRLKARIAPAEEIESVTKLLTHYYPGVIAQTPDGLKVL